MEIINTSFMMKNKKIPMLQKKYPCCNMLQTLEREKNTLTCGSGTLLHYAHRILYMGNEALYQNSEIKLSVPKICLE